MQGAGVKQPTVLAACDFGVGAVSKHPVVDPSGRRDSLQPPWHAVSQKCIESREGILLEKCREGDVRHLGETTILDFACSFVILSVLAAWYGFEVTPRLLILPVLMAIALASGLTIGLFFAALQVRYRDVQKLVGFLVQAWAFATPVAYAGSLVAERLPEPFWTLYRLNPMYCVVEGFRWAVLGTGELSPLLLVCVSGFVACALVASAAYFQRTEHWISDLL